MNQDNNMADACQPLTDSWWEQRKTEMPPDEAPILAPFENTRPGFEIGMIGAFSRSVEYFQDIGNGRYQVCLWNIWERQADPADADPVKQQINRMQQGCGRLSDDDRYIRIQIACVRRCWWRFPSNVDCIIRGIGAGQVDLTARVSCEPPWYAIIEVLRHRRHLPGATAGRYADADENYDEFFSERKRLGRAYMTILTWWTFGGDLHCLKRELPERADMAETIYRHLGPPTPQKILLVEKLWAALGWQTFPARAFAGPTSTMLTAIYDKALEQEFPNTDKDIAKLIAPRDQCHHAFFRRIDHQIANIGAGRIVALPGQGEQRRMLLETVTNYVHVLGSWLAGRPPEEAVRIWPACESKAGWVYETLGQPTPVKRWLVACLWKMQLDADASLGRGALDEEPERFAIPPEALA